MFLLTDPIFTVFLESSNSWTESYQNWRLRIIVSCSSVRWPHWWISWRTTWIGEDSSIFVWMVQQNRRIVETFWRNSTAQKVNTSFSYWVLEPVVWDWIFKLPIQSSFLTRIGILTRFVVEIFVLLVILLIIIEIIIKCGLDLRRICKHKIVLIVLAKRMKFEFCVWSPLTRLRKEFWQLLDTSWIWMKRSYRLVCSIRNQQDRRDSNFCKPFFIKMTAMMR